MRKLLFTTTVCLLLLIIIALARTGTVDAALIDQPMTGATAPGWVLGGTASASLTGNGTIDPVGDGWLRLTNNATNQSGYAYYDTAISLSQGALIQFDYVTWGGDGADGYTMFLFDAAVPTFNIGASGGSLGYARKSVAPISPGISGGYVGIGVDEYGNFANPTEGRYLGPGQRPNTVTVRGPVSSAAPPTGGTQGTESYPWIATSPNNGPLWSGQITRPTPTSPEYRRVVMKISPAPSPLIDVWVQFGFNQPLTPMITGQPIGVDPPAGLKLGYAASTGGSTNYHEIRNLVVEPAGVATSINLGISKTASVATITAGSPITYTVIVRNFGPNNITANGVGITDTVPATITGVTWSCAATGGAACGSASGSGNALNTTANLPFNGAVTYTISGTLTGNPGASLINTATLTIPAGITDYRPSDDTATTTTPVIIPSLDIGITKTSPATSYLLWDTVSYSVVARNNGPTNVTAYNVGINDTIPPELTGVTWTCVAAGGATCVDASGSGNALDTTANLPLNATATYTITGTLSSLPVGGTLSNTANLAVPAGYTDTNAANNSATATISAGGSTPGSGNKPLYLSGTPGLTLSRTPTSGTPADITLNEGVSQSWTLAPGLSSPVTISPSISATVPVMLFLGETGTGSNRDITVSLTCVGTGTTLSQSRTGIDVNPALWVTFNLPFPGGSDVTCTDQWRLTVQNNTTGTGERALILSPVNGGAVSRVVLPSKSVININNSDITFHSVAYPGVNPLASLNVGQTVYIRAAVTDPFGSYDITGATLTLRDSTGAIKPAGIPVAMTAQTPDPTPGSRIYEYAYTVPAAGPGGNWTALVVAREGTENTVSDNAQAVMPVTVPLPSLSVIKYANGSVTPGAVKPGQDIPYLITVTNTGAGKAWEVNVSDALSTYTALKLNTLAFTDGIISSGLSMTGSTTYYSYDNGNTWTTSTPPDLGGGYNGTVTNWKIVFDPAVQMNSNNAYFTISYTCLLK